MDSYNTTTDIGNKGVSELMPLIKSWADKNEVIDLITPGDQRYKGDLAIHVNGRLLVIEIKTEKRYTGNLFLETWSNSGMKYRGWMDVSQADVLMYFFQDVGRVFVFDFPKLKEWFSKHSSNYREVSQRKYDQPNETRGVLIPLSALSETGFDEYRRKENGLFEKADLLVKDIAYDIETYPNCFILCAMTVDGSTQWEFEVSPWRNDQGNLFEWLSWVKNSQHRMVGFNNVGFDYPILHMLWGMRAVVPHMLYERAVTIIKSEGNERFAHIVRPSDVLAPQVDLFKIHHFDNVARQTSLKALEFNMRMRNISDLPFPPGKTLDSKECDTLRAYCSHDVKATVEFYHKSLDAIKFREKLAQKYEGEFLNYSDVKIGKVIFQKTLEAAGVQTYEYGENGRQPKQSPRPLIKLADCVPSGVHFLHPEFKRIKRYFEQQVITQTKGAFDNLKAHVDGLDYWFGTGGLHASVENEFFEADEQMMIFDMDVTSLYPSIAIENSYFPEHLGPTFVDVYRNLRAQRLQYPKGTPENNMLKLALNGVYGASNDKFSIFYDPLFTMQITIGGQLMLALLIERLIAIHGLRVIQANTDGITVHAPRSSKFLIDAVCQEWERQTRLSLEYAEYSKMAIADVNSYIAQKPSGEVKRKGRYEYDLEWHQNASALVVPKVAEKVILEGVTVMDTLLEWPDSMDFMLRVKVPRSSRLVMSENGRDTPLENTQRYYVSQTGGYLFKIMPPLAKAPGKWRRIAVESGFTVCPCNNLDNSVRYPINYHWYAAEVEKLTLGVI